MGVARAGGIEVSVSRLGGEEEHALAWKRGDFERERVRASIRADLFGTERVPARLGRFEVRERLGGGASGVVYRAYDPELDREVALKLLAAARTTAERVGERVREEGRALARLSHPNVVAVHEVGEHEGETFLAMELVRGMDLRRWLAAGERSVGEILGVFAQAGAGLVAAHRAGVVHRDFKPDNVLVGDDGVARVADFGVAASVDPGEGAALATGRAGTPAYMAPEQWLGEPTGAPSDQFAFAAALFEALHGSPPFGTGDRDTLRENAVQGRVGPASRSVPKRVARAVARGLAVRPADRHESMDALLAVLRPRTPSRSRLFAVLGGAVAIAIALAAAIGQSTGAARCDDPAERLRGVWDPERRAAVERAFDRSALPFADSAFARSAEGLDRYAAEWTRASSDVCESVYERRDLSESAAAPRRHCLELRREALRATVELLLRADADVVARAHQLAGSLASIADCAVADSAPDAELARRVLALEPELAGIEASLGIGRAGDAETMEDALAKARALGHAPTEARALIAKGRSRHYRGDYAGARETLFEAVGCAQDDTERVLRSRAAVELARTLGFEGSGDYAESLRWLDLAQAAAGEHEPPGDEAERLEVRASTLRWLDRFDEALAAATRSAEIVERTYGSDDLRTAATLTRLGNIYTLTDDLARGCESIRRGFDIRLGSLGPDHPELIESHDRLAACARSEERFEEASAHHGRAIALARANLEPVHKTLAYAIYAAAWTELVRGRFVSAGDLYREARSQFEAIGNAELEGASVAGLGEIADRTRDRARAIALYDEAIAIFGGAEHVTWAIVLARKARVLRALGRHDEALPHLERAIVFLRGRERARYQSYTALVELELGLLELGRNRHGDAVASIESALATIDVDNDWGRLLPPIQLHLARALVAAGGDRTRAEELARRAREDYARRGERGAPMVAEVDAWLADPSLEARASEPGHADGLSQWGPFW